MTRDRKLRRIEAAVFEGDLDALDAALSDLEPTIARARLLDALAAGMERVRKEVHTARRAVAEVLLSAEVFRRGVERSAAFADAPAEAIGAGIVIGVVEGDVHDMGKNIVAVVLEAAGHAVIDLGRDVPRQSFVRAIEAERPALVALSTMMSTTLESMRGIISALRSAAPDLGIVVGGAALDGRLAESLGADGYAESAATAPDEVARVLASRA